MITVSLFDVQNLKQVQNYSDDELISMVNLHNAVNGKQKLDKRVRQNWISVLRVLSDFVDELPISPRGTFYQVESRGWIEKTEAAVTKIQNITTKMRKDRVIPCSIISDGSREINELPTYENLPGFLDLVSKSYRVNPWLKQRYAPIIGLEKEGLTGIIEPITHEYRVPLCALRGFSSISFAQDICQKIEFYLKHGVRPVLLYFGDLDPSGLSIPVSLVETIRETFGVTDFDYRRIGLNYEQISEYSISTRKLKKPEPGKRGDPRLKNWPYGDMSAELDALRPGQLRDMVRDAILEYVDRDVFYQSMHAETADVNQLSQIIGGV